MSLLTVDLSLVSRAQAGDGDAASRLAAQVRPLVERTAHRFFSDPGKAEDVTQTALMKAFARVRDLRSPEAFAGWLVSVTRNECLNELARHRLPQVHMSALEEEGATIEAPAGGDGDPEEALVRVQLRSLVRQVIATLPSHYRRTLTMRALEDRSYEEIGAELGVPLPVARLWYCRARKRFRQSFVEAMVARRPMPAGCQAMGGDIAELIEGSLSRADRDRVQGHLAGCHVCRQTEDELRSTAFRAPARSWILTGLAALRVPGHAARTVASAGHSAAAAVKATSWTVRLAAGAAGTAAAASVAAPIAGLPIHSSRINHAVVVPAVAAHATAHAAGRAHTTAAGVAAAAAKVPGSTRAAAHTVAGATVSAADARVLSEVARILHSISAFDGAGALSGQLVAYPTVLALVHAAVAATQSTTHAVGAAGTGVASGTSATAAAAPGAAAPAAAGATTAVGSTVSGAAPAATGVTGTAPASLSGAGAPTSTDASSASVDTSGGTSLLGGTLSLLGPITH